MLLEKPEIIFEEKESFEITGLPGKLADCQISKKEGTELYIVEEILQVAQPNKEEIENFKLFYL